jgi:hypothetical protein
MNMCGFCRTIDLGKRDFYFSCKHYSSKVYTSFTKLWALAQGVQQNWFFNFWIFLRFYMNFPSCRQHTLKEKNLLTHRSLGFSTLHNHTLGLYSQVPARKQSLHRGPDGAGGLVAGEGSPELANKRHGREIGITSGLLEAVVGSGRTPTNRGGGAMAERPWEFDSRRGQGR